MNLRPRNKSKELDRDFKYQANSNIEKVVDFMNSRNALTLGKGDELIANSK